MLAKALQRQVLKDLYKQMGSEFTPILYKYAFPQFWLNNIPLGQRVKEAVRVGWGLTELSGGDFAVDSVCRI